jgi:hypothetical protein
MRQLVASVASLDPAKVPQTPEQATAWKQNLQQLVQQGAAAVPAIQEFLDKNADFGFGKDAGQMLGYASERYAMFDALRQIGGPEAASAMAGVLQTTADPHEIALLAQDLEQVAPGQYPQAALDAARQTLAMVTDGKLSQTDVAPLFDVLAKYGGAGAAAEIEQASANYKYYSAIALSQLPDGAGIPSLVRMVQDSSNGGGPVRNVPALEMLTEAAAQNSDARNALMDLARANGIPSRYWAYLAPLLAGDQIQYLDSASASSATASAANNSDLRTYHIASGNQNFYSAPPVGGFTQDQINRQSQLIDGLLSVTSDPATVQMLQNTKALLQKRLGQTAAAASPH